MRECGEKEEPQENRWLSCGIIFRFRKSDPLIQPGVDKKALTNDNVKKRIAIKRVKQGRWFSHRNLEVSEGNVPLEEINWRISLPVVKQSK